MEDAFEEVGRRCSRALYITNRTHSKANYIPGSGILDGNNRMDLSRKGHTRVSSNWHSTIEEAFGCIRQTCIVKRRDVPALSRKRCRDAPQRYRYTVKTKVASAAEVDQQRILRYEPQPTAPPGNPIADDLPGCEPQQIRFADEMSRNDAFNDLVDLFLARRSSHDDDIFCRDVCYSLLQESTRTYLRSLNQQRAMSHSSLE